MTLHERVIVSAYTGYLMCDFSHVHKYIEEKMGRPVWTHEMRASNKSFREELTKRVRPDFLKLYGNETIEKVGPLCNAARLREAAVRSLNEICETVADAVCSEETDPLVAAMNHRADRLRAALDAPPRNCDVGTAEEQEDRYIRFCDSHYKNHGSCFGCAALKLRGRCEFAWAKMSYEEDPRKDARAQNGGGRWNR